MVDAWYEREIGENSAVYRPVESSDHRDGHRFIHGVVKDVNQYRHGEHEDLDGVERVLVDFSDFDALLSNLLCTAAQHHLERFAEEYNWDLEFWRASSDQQGDIPVIEEEDDEFRGYA